MKEIPRDECLRLLGRRGIGRLGFVLSGRPLVFPVNYALDGEDVVFRTAAGSKLDGTVGSWVAFEVDGIDPMYHSGWSVVVQGRATEITAPFELDRLMRLPLQPWDGGDKHHWVRIAAEAVTGRQIGDVGSPSRRRLYTAASSPVGGAKEQG
jgi:nitroimidazol reductase NimA-like FMN-containing flavoprotein (pyridoxamine 5'-phosphate oxidase superfamily)